MEWLKSLGIVAQPTENLASRRCPRLPRRPKNIDRCRIFDDFINVLGHPSRGGLIVLERADAIDFDFLGMSRFDPPLARATTPLAEDDFCQRLLLLGAKWFDSESRYSHMGGMREGDSRDLRDDEEERVPALILGERQWVKVGWPSKPAGGVWVGEWDTNIPGILEDELVPGDAAKVTLARNMDERCDILKGMGAKFYKSLEKYNGATYLKAWQTKWEGDVEPLQQTWPNNNAVSQLPT